MNKSIIFKGKIQFVGVAPKSKNIGIKYDDPSFENGFHESLADTMMSSFENLKLSPDEKKQLSRTHRKLLNCYRHLNPFSLNMHAQKLIHEINHSKQTNIVVEANHYGAYICLAALYSGKLSEKKHVEFILEKAPLTLFPKALIKSEPKASLHSAIFNLNEDCWLSPFSSLYTNQRIKYSLNYYKKAA